MERDKLAMGRLASFCALRSKGKRVSTGDVNSLVRDQGSRKILPVPAATVVQQFDVEAGSGDANNRSQKFRGQETLKGAGGQVDRGAGGGWEKARPRGNLSMGIHCNRGAEKPESHESGLASPPTGGCPKDGMAREPKQGCDWSAADHPRACSRREFATQNRVAKLPFDAPGQSSHVARSVSEPSKSHNKDDSAAVSAE